MKLTVETEQDIVNDPKININDLFRNQRIILVILHAFFTSLHHQRPKNEI